MMTGNSISKVPVVSKQYCSGSEIVLYVRRRPHVVNGGGFVVVDGNQKIVFRVDGCGILGRKEELVVRAGDGSELLLVRRKGGVMEALSLCRRWRGYAHDLEGSQKPIFCLREPSNSCLWMKNPITISVTSNEYRGFRDFEIRGDFTNRNCSIVDSSGRIAAQVGMCKEVEVVMASRELYNVVVKPGIDQAFVFGVIAILDYIYDGSTRC
ncbi:protein LURP-one-related 6-like [Coffea arabica]|uniref:Protein LURP-one-related 6-like n=1 Tax=Coffea arabica TaxID=13443 RepID=A0ABM4UNV6_COFAR|nr:protein LURP-one-related 6-like [Coffea arabica]